MKSLLLILLSLSGLFSAAQIQVDTTLTAEQLVDKLVKGNGVRLGTVRYKGVKLALGYFQADSAVLGFKSGILLSTGSVFDAFGENDTPGKSGVLSTGNKSRGSSDKDLNKIARGKTKEVSILEFDFIPLHNKVSFNYCFGSEEYRDYVGTPYNDVFAFMVYGPGMKKQNVALIPGTKTPVTINNVNHKKNKQWYMNNDHFLNYGLSKSGGAPKLNIFQFIRLLFVPKKSGNGKFISNQRERKKLNQYLVNNFQYDGFTRMLTAEFYVVPYQIYHLKIAIGDVADRIFDSGVFIQEGSFICVRDTTQPGFKEYLQDSSLTADVPLYELQETESPEEEFDLITVYFDSGKSIFSEEYISELDSFGDYLKANETEKFILIGYTDNTGNFKSNTTLSEARAKAVMDYLIQHGVNPQQLEYKGLSQDYPVGDNSTKDGRAQNRRVEIIRVEP